MVKRGWMAGGVERYGKLAKSMHAVVRSAGSSWCPPLDLPHGLSPDPLLYLHLLGGRCDMNVLTNDEDLTAREVMGRPKTLPTPSGPSEKAFVDAFARQIEDDRIQVHRTVMRHRGETLDDLLANFVKHGASGSCKRLRGKVTIRYQGEEFAVNNPSKLLWMARLSANDVVEIIHEFAENPVRTVAVKKVEPLRLRLMLPGPEAHWLVEMLALLDGEKGLFRKDPQLEINQQPFQALSNVVDRLSWIAQLKHGSAWQLLARTLTAYCQDFDDFNNT
jgi:hypothetical protein